MLCKWYPHYGLTRVIGMVKQSIRHKTARRQSTVSNGHSWKRLWVASAIAGGGLFYSPQIITGGYMFGIKGFAKGLAKAQLRSFFAYRGKYPEMKPEELYLAALKMRPGYSENLILGLIEDTKEFCTKNGKPFNFQEVVYSLATFEYEKTHPDSSWEKGSKDRAKIKETVKSIVPANI